MPLDGSTFDFRNPDYAAVFHRRMEWLERLRAKPSLLEPVKQFYRENPADFISDWGCTYEPRNPERGLPAIIPFILFERQRNWIDYVLRKWRARERGLTEKSRDSGVSWLAMALSDTLCLFNEGLAIGVGSRKAEYVDELGDPSSLLWKARFFLEYLPVEFRGTWTPRNAPHMLVGFPDTGSVISGEAGDNIGRGARTSLFFVDETAFVQHQNLIEASLSQTTNCRIDISTPNGLGNPFEQNRHSGKIEVFTFHWREDPRKDEAWYEKQKLELSPVVLAQEVDIDYTASVERIIIPHAWVLAAIDAHVKLKVDPTGAAFGALDIADEGADTNAFCGARGILVEHLEEWSGKGADIFDTVERAFMLADDLEYRRFRYDADGMGAGARGDARIINARRQSQNRRPLQVEAFRGSEGVIRPEAEDVKGRKNKDFFKNRKAQAWWSLRTRFQNTYRWIEEGKTCDPDDIISLSSSLPNLMKLANELAQPTYSVDPVGKIIVDKAPDGALSPNLGDAVMMRFAPARKPIVVTEEVLRQFSVPRR